MKKWLTCLILGAMLATLSACGGETAEQPSGGEAASQDTEISSPAVEETEEIIEETQDPALLDELPKEVHDYDGYTFTVLSHQLPDSSIAWKVVDIYTEEQVGERINDAVYQRNLTMEERFGVKVAQNLQDDPYSVAVQLITAQDDSFDLLQTNTQDQCSLAVSGYLLNMNDLEYIDFDKAWWDTASIKGISIGNKVFYAIGDSSLNGKKATWVVLFNKMLTSNAGVPELYSLVKEGGWTLDKLQEYGKQIAQDTDGDGTMTWGTDVFGVGLQYEVVIPLLLGDGKKLLEVNEDGSLVYSMNSPAVVDAMEKIYNFLNTGDDYILNCNHYDGKIPSQWVEFRNRFMADQIGFFMGHLGTVTLVGGDMNNDFGILPFPKLTEEQDGYHSTFQYGNAYAVSAPKSATDLTRTGMLTEAYQMLSHTTVLPAYYDYTLTFRNARDEASGEMLDIIFGSRNFDLSLAFNSTTNTQGFLQDIVKAESFTYASKEAANQKVVTKNMENLLKKMNEN